MTGFIALDSLEKCDLPGKMCHNDIKFNVSFQSAKFTLVVISAYCKK